MKNKKILLGIVTALLIVAAFFVGKSYGSSHPKAGARSAMMNGAGGFNRAGMGGGAAGGFAGRGGAGATMGQVISKDANSITVSVMGGGSKIILYSPSTTVAKSATGAIDDVTVGSTITAIGSANSDGSIAATSIQIRPAGAAPAKQ